MVCYIHPCLANLSCKLIHCYLWKFSVSDHSRPHTHPENVSHQRCYSRLVKGGKIKRGLKIEFETKIYIPMYSMSRILEALAHYHWLRILSSETFNIEKKISVKMSTLYKAEYRVSLDFTFFSSIYCCLAKLSRV